MSALLGIRKGAGGLCYSKLGLHKLGFRPPPSTKCVRPMRQIVTAVSSILNGFCRHLRSDEVEGGMASV